MDWKDVEAACDLIKEYCRGFGSCNHGCRLFDCETYSCKVDNQPMLWNVSEKESK